MHTCTRRTFLKNSTLTGASLLL
ncbi:MAG: twin-arginine translocation signal domain-containing protein, partial [Deltaproteobacteria bacterium]|nr:twin-arginine translocation signal domain-containing protein [Deltaproteobacteria bacterium]